MKKQMSPSLAAEKKLSLNKKTISNLSSPMATTNKMVDGPTKKGAGCFTHTCNPSW